MLNQMKSIPCQKCNPTGKYSYWNKWIDCLECSVCGFERPYHSRNKFKKTEPNETQLKTLDELKDALTKRHITSSSNEMEFKEFSWEMWPNGSIMVRSVIGMVEDEGTLASIFCRDIRSIEIGRRGGLTLINAGIYIESEKTIVRGTKRSGLFEAVHGLTTNY